MCGGNRSEEVVGSGGAARVRSIEAGRELVVGRFTELLNKGDARQ